LKLFIGSLLVFSAIILFLFALFPSDISVSRVVQINRPPAEVAGNIDDLRKWKSWNEFVIHPSPGEMNFKSHVFKMDSAFIDIGGVHIQLTGAFKDSVATLWRHGGDSFAGIFKVVEMNGQTILAWDLKFHIKWYPWAKLASMFYDKNLGPEMEKSLLNLKNVMESNAP
jgi:Polyketide cyclase / dehydrase and lipid transport